jgi:hypothetical protein
LITRNIADFQHHTYAERASLPLRLCAAAVG